MNWIEDLIPLVAVVMIFGIPIAAILTAHQRKVMEMMHGTRNDVQNQNAMMNEVQALRHEIAEMREHLNHQAIQLDDLRSNGPRIAHRLNEENVNGS